MPNMIIVNKLYKHEQKIKRSRKHLMNREVKNNKRSI